MYLSLIEVFLIAPVTISYTKRKFLKLKMEKSYLRLTIIRVLYFFFFWRKESCNLVALFAFYFLWKLWFESPFLVVVKKKEKKNSKLTILSIERKY